MDSVASPERMDVNVTGQSTIHGVHVPNPSSLPSANLREWARTRVEPFGGIRTLLSQDQALSIFLGNDPGGFSDTKPNWIQTRSYVCVTMP